MMAQTGAFMVLSRLPSERCGLSRCLASGDFTNTKRAGLQLARSGRASRDRRSCAAARRGRRGRARRYGCAPSRNSWSRPASGSLPRSNRPDLLHFGNEVPEQVLDAVTQRRRRAGAARAGAAHMQEDHAVAIALEGDVAAVLGHRRTHARLEQLLDGLDGLLVLRRVEFARRRSFPSRTARPR